MRQKITYGKQCIEDDDIRAVIEVLKSDWLTQGPTVARFEEELCLKFGSAYASALANGTAALHLAGIALGWKEGDVVLTTPLTFLATANCILYAGAVPDFVDIDAKHYTIDVEKLEAKIKQYRGESKKVKAVIGVDYAGHPCDWKALRFLADKYQFQLIDDACHAMGATYANDDRYFTKYADIAIFSFHPVKHITTGEGGAILTNSDSYNEKIQSLRTHGVTNDVNQMEKCDGPWYFEMHELGFNYRITDIQCALGISQLKKLGRFVDKRQQIACYYDGVLGSDERFIAPRQSDDVSHAYHLYPLQIRFDRVAVTKENLFRKLSERNIFCQVHYVPIHLQPYYRKRFGFQKGEFPIAEKFYEREVSLPVYPQLEQNAMEYVSEAIIDIVK